MRRNEFNHGWYCRSLTRGGDPQQVTLPHDAMISEPRDETSVAEGNIGWYVGGDYEYTKDFDVPASGLGANVLLEFEGVSHGGEVFLNGEKISYRPYAYTNFYVDLSDKLLAGQTNHLSVIAHNQEQPNSRWYTGTGIYRPVTLHTSGEKYIPVNGIRVRTISISPATVEVTVRTSCEGKVKVDILRSGNEVATGEASSENIGEHKIIPAVFGLSAQTISPREKCTFEAKIQFEIPDAQTWSVESPNLYTCHVSFCDDEASENFGIRTLCYNANDGMTINGQRVILRGACIHHDNGLLGAATYPEAEERRVRLLKENGYNAIRCAHNPCSKYLLEACDKLGMLVMDEFVDMWYIHKTKFDYVSDLPQWWQDDLREMVEKDYCHPSVVMYSTGNEVAETGEKKGIAFTGEMTNYLHSLDNSRPVSCGINIFFNFLYSIGFGVYSDDKADKAETKAKNTAGSKKKKKHVGSDFYNTVAAVLGCGFMKIGATLPFCDWKTRDAFANMDIAGYNYGILRYNHDLKKYPERLILGSETFCSDAFTFWEKAKQNNRIIGDFVWSGTDYIGETNDGAAEFTDYKSENPASRMTGGNGRIDLTGKPKAEAAYTRVALERENGPYIAVMPVYEKETPRITGWQMTKAVESWSWHGCEGMKTTVEVYARAHTAELIINGKSVGKKRLKKCKAIFRTVYYDGKIESVTYDKAGNVCGRYSMTTADNEAVLSMKPEMTSVHPEGLIYLPIKYTDKKGIWQPMEKHNLQITAEDGKILGFGSACPYYEGNYTTDCTPTYFGEALAIVQAEKPGKVKITVRDEKDSVEAEVDCTEKIS